MKPTVTVGVCVHNCENMLMIALDSIIRQDYPRERMQVIIVDDGSEDSTPLILSEYISKIGNPAKFIRTSWQGLGHARNLVINNAEGDFLVWVDADEVLTENYIRKQVKFLEENPNVGITAGIFKIIPGNLILNLELIPFIINHLNFDRPKSFIWKTEKLIGTGGSAFRVKALKQVNGFNENIRGAGEDIDLILRIKKAGWLIRLNDAGLYELHGGLATFKDLWKKYFWYGYGCQKTFDQNNQAFSILRMSPLAGIVAGILYSSDAYKYLRQKRFFLLPFHFGFKNMAWTVGFGFSQIRTRLKL